MNRFKLYIYIKNTIESTITYLTLQHLRRLKMSLWPCPLWLSRLDHCPVTERLWFDRGQGAISRLRFNPQSSISSSGAYGRQPRQPIDASLSSMFLSLSLPLSLKAMNKMSLGEDYEKRYLFALFRWCYVGSPSYGGGGFFVLFLSVKKFFSRGSPADIPSHCIGQNRSHGHH